MTMDMPKNVDIAINLLQSAGFEAYAVGGCVRDSLLGKTPNDWDITTSAKPENMKSVFADFHCIDTGIKHGTVTVVIDGEPLEITTFRLDGEYEDNRHPKSVTFTSDLGADLGRRDFTVNAMAYSKMTGTVDLFGGQNDLKNGIIRCVGDPDRRFNEDALRILRALRFASALDFEIEEKTAQSLLKNRALLGNISEERIAKELLKLVCGKGAKRILTDFAPVLFEILPELQPMYKNSHDNPHHCYDIYEHTLIAVESIDPEPTLRFAMLLHDCGKPAVKKFDENGVAHFYGHQRISVEISAQILARLKVSNKFRDEILFLVSNHDRWELYENTEKNAALSLKIRSRRRAESAQGHARRCARAIAGIQIPTRSDSRCRRNCEESGGAEAVPVAERAPDKRAHTHGYRHPAGQKARRGARPITRRSDRRGDKKHAGSPDDPREGNIQ